MTKVKVDPGICGLKTVIEATSMEDDMEVQLKVVSACESVRNMMQELGDTFDTYDICLKKPGTGPFFAYASEKFPGHCGCPTIAGIIKCAEVECNLALPKDTEIKFE
ncbi:DUF6951 family protein [Parasporobacterium paucivorans]|uniref:Uncharacterized protein n=1 Tax=Parasporobacterium paucivorans DSM 15970 TaxID=1122934 RepID=A0A1M6CA81_9FIRM|nr:hypothetical protein [Parasporobacterium paucivorans]SHI57919.1 hypothetical protein SAMN02745691_00515 [Parasporobacterium paucivorans DSM 15970]